MATGEGWMVRPWSRQPSCLAGALPLRQGACRPRRRISFAGLVTNKVRGPMWVT